MIALFETYQKLVLCLQGGTDMPVVVVTCSASVPFAVVRLLHMTLSGIRKAWRRRAISSLSNRKRDRHCSLDNMVISTPGYVHFSSFKLASKSNSSELSSIESKHLSSIADTWSRRKMKQQNSYQ